MRVRVWRWNIDTTSLAMVDQHKVGKGRVTGASWSKADSGIVVTSGEGRTLAVWDLVTNTTRSLVYGRNTIFCLACHPDDPDLVAIGCKLGCLQLGMSPNMEVMIGEEK